MVRVWRGASRRRGSGELSTSSPNERPAKLAAGRAGCAWLGVGVAVHLPGQRSAADNGIGGMHVVLESLEVSRTILDRDWGGGGENQLNGVFFVFVVVITICNELEKFEEKHLKSTSRGGGDKFNPERFRV